MDPRKILFGMSAPHDPVPDPKNEGLSCSGCLFMNEKASVCREAGAEAVKRGLRDCDVPDQFGQLVVYVRVAVDPRQQDLLKEEPDVQET